MIVPGTRLGPYEITARIGAGGMGEVFRARDARIGRDVAIKVLPTAFAADSDRMLRFEQEARSAGSLQHPNLVTIYDIGKEDGAPYIVMELLDGETLRDKLSSLRADRKKNLLAVADAADAIAAAHRAGVIHRDLKPENIMVTNSGYTKVLDFGLAKLAARVAPADASATEVKKTDPGVVVGTAAYMSPEQAQGQPADERSDIFALGCILYEALAGKRPFGGNSTLDTLHNIVHATPAPLQSTSPELVRITRKCLAKDPEERYQSAKDLAIDLRAAVRDLGSAPDAVPVARTRGSAIWLFAGFALAIAAAIASWYYAKHTRAASSSLALLALTNSGDVISAAVSPDGKYIAYVTSRGDQALWLRQIGTAQSILLVPPAHVGYWGESFTPDGSSIYYATKTQGAKGTLYQIATLGGTPRKILEVIDSAAAFSPDGKQFAFLRSDFPAPGQSALMISNADGSAIRALAIKRSPDLMAPIFYGGPSWSPDGSRIATSVLRSNGGDTRLSVFDVATGKETIVARPGWTSIAQSAWLPDGSAIIVIGTMALSDQLWRVSYPSGEVRKITSGVLEFRYPTMTANGRAMVAIAVQGSTSLTLHKPDGTLIRAINATQSDGRQGVAFARDGRIAFASISGETMEVWTCDANGGDRRQLTNRGAALRDLVVMPDGSIAFVAFDKDGSSIMHVNPDGTGLSRLTPASFNTLMSVSPDGKTMYFNADLGKGSLLYRMPIPGTPALLAPFRVAAPAISPDGKVIATFAEVQSGPKLTLIDAASGAVIRQFASPAQTIATRIRWTPDGKSIVYSALGSLIRFDVSTGEHVELLHYDPPVLISRFDIAPDGTLAVAHGTISRDAYLITGFE